MTKFIILTTQRTGSTFFIKKLDSHPSIECHDEIFINRKFDKQYNKDRFYHYCSKNLLRLYGYKIGSLNKISLIFNYIPVLEFIDRIFSMPLNYLVQSFLKEFYDSKKCINTKIDCKGFKLMYNQAELFEWQQKYYIGNDVKIIHWIRRNVLKILISKEMMKARGISHSTKPLQKIRISLDTKKLIQKLDKIIDRRRFFQKQLSKTNHIEVCYEDFLEHEEIYKKKVLEYLNVDANVKLFSELKKITSDKIEDVLTNYSDVYNVLKGTYYQQYL